MKTVLITGGSGFIGRYVVEDLKQIGVKSIVLDQIAYPDPEVKTEIASLLDENRIDSIIMMYQPDVIIHMAAIARVTYENTIDIYNTNVLGTEVLLNSAKKYGKKDLRIVLMSTAGVYGNQGSGTYTEEFPYRPENHYSYTKMIIELMTNQYPSLDIKIVRPFNIIGVGQNKDFIVPKLVEHFARSAKEIRLGNIKAERDYVDIEFCSHMICRLAFSNNTMYQTYNICSGNGHSVEELYEILCGISGMRPEIIIDERFVRKNEVWHLVGSTERWKSLMNGDSPERVEEVLKKMYFTERKINEKNKTI